MNKVITLSHKNSEGLTQLINEVTYKAAGEEVRIISILHDGKKFVAFINIMMPDAEKAKLAMGASDVG